MTASEFIESLKVIQFQEGDRLVIKLPSGSSEPSTWGVIRGSMEMWAPGVPYLVLMDGIEIEVVRGLESVAGE